MPEGLPNVNLLPQYERERSSNYIFFLIFIIVIISAFIFLSVYYFTTKNKLEATNAEVQQLTEQRNLLEIKVAELETDGSSSLEQAVSFVEQYELPTSELIVELDNILPDHSYLMEYEYDAHETKVKAHFETLDKMADYTSSLLASEFIQDVKANSIESFTLKEELDNDTTNDFNVIPRYEGEFSLVIDKLTLKGESAEDE